MRIYRRPLRLEERFSRTRCLRKTFKSSSTRSSKFSEKTASLRKKETWVHNLINGNQTIIKCRPTKRCSFPSSETLCISVHLPKPGQTVIHQTIIVSLVTKMPLLAPLILRLTPLSPIEQNPPLKLIRLMI